MERLEFTYPATRTIPHRAHVGVVGSGDLEVLLTPIAELTARVIIRTSVGGFSSTWKAVLDRFFATYDGKVLLEINDSGATPGAVNLRLWQAVEASEKGAPA